MVGAGRVPLGLVTVLCGIAGLGKSSWTCLLAGRLSLGELGPPATTLIATAEDSLATTVRPRLEAVRADLELVKFVKIDSHKDQSVRRALAPLHRLAENYGCAVIGLLHLRLLDGLQTVLVTSWSHRQKAP